jgi:hypothetical protein
MQRRTFNFALLPTLLVAVGALSACEAPPPRPAFPEIGFSHLPPIRLDVAEIEVVQAYTPQLTPPNVEHIFPQPPYEVAERWARQRLVAVGNYRRAVVTVRQASVAEKPLPRTQGIKGIFTTDQSERYEGRLVVTIEIKDVDGGGGTVTGEVGRVTSVPEDVSLSAREKIWFEMTEKMMHDLDVQLEAGIKRTFFRYVVL